ncbi:UNVERIFIED_ORG: pyridoxamine 5'-phosphate oxidase [Pseudomonas lini]|uniref:Pyridoxine/pyridoxamine 5'-phosphate oxidase n=1 Tax=Pseudomonas viciae TaxID=2505979 RepID=A0A4P7PG35_9PSED|nr:pyridoxamine 5'-phosphate oxidase [Pseudomonas viciae]QBZ89599.1 pyridoxamine 5'-phosphate oxidase [Pseudomonas viciae]UZE89061.1 pyridoxamine 5'-phosphate oxidase [Pseudomonas viciae]WGO95876.1 pyridoxamine 5'-phosphate oxidase [Pseudomonas viciae]
MPLSLAKMRRQYTLDGLDEAQAPDDPMVLFGLWMQQARDTESPPVEANSMALATVDGQGRPHCRILLLKGFSSEGFSFFGNYDSAKGQDLAANPWAAMTFFWPGLERQVRIEGVVGKLAPALSDAYFASRSVASRLGAWASPQSRPLDDRATLEILLAQTGQHFADQPVPRPEHWGGYCLRPERLEFWQGRADRLHDRLDYRRQAGVWQRTRLAP